MPGRCSASPSLSRVEFILRVTSADRNDSCTAEEKTAQSHRARAFAASKDVETEIARNLAMAERLQFNGTPSWVAGDQAFSGAVSSEVLADALAQETPQQDTRQDKGA